MSVTVKFRVPAAEFTLGEALTNTPEMRIRLDRAFPLDETFVPYLWVEKNHLDEVEAALRSEVDLTTFRVVDTVDDEVLLRVEWSEQLDGLLAVLTETGGRILDGIGESGEWTLTVRFETRDDLSRFYQACADRSISLTIDAVHDPGVSDHDARGFGLTDAQRETLVTALEAGYFEVPRRKTVVDLAEELGVSDTAFSERLRRALSTLLRATLPETDANDHEGVAENTTDTSERRGTE